MGSLPSPSDSGALERRRREHREDIIEALTEAASNGAIIVSCTQVKELADNPFSKFNV